MSSVVYWSPFSENFLTLCLQMVRFCTNTDKQQEKNWNGTEFSVRFLLFAAHTEGFPALFTEKYADFIEANRTEDSVERLKELKRLVSEKNLIWAAFNWTALH